MMHLIVIGAVALSIIWLFIRVLFSFLFRIQLKTIHMQRPTAGAERESKQPSKLKTELLEAEAQLRKLAYLNTTIQTDHQFYTDQDMISDYYLVVVYDKKNKTPLLSSRHYFNHQVIGKMLRGDETAIGSTSINLSEFEPDEIFFCDRLSANVNHAYYQRYRRYIFLQYYAEIHNQNRSRMYILMARSEQPEKLLTKYLRLGLVITGSVLHNGIKHWVLLGNVEKNYQYITSSVAFGLGLRLKKMFHVIK
ncbi:MAG: hypothetical protein JKY18_09845 [Flavobacteriales bacterium]|nr:hypothetical protein [Flavobacteriales bacterium]